MMDIWEILRLEETCDKSAIRRAYAERAKEFNPEEHPEEFLRIREAYEKALAYARAAGVAMQSTKGTDKIETQDSPNQQIDKSQLNKLQPNKPQQDKSQQDKSQNIQQGEITSQESKSSTSGFHWDFTEENPFRSGEGIRRFRELYTGKRSKDRTAWSDYFLSDVFLEGYQEKDFAELMLEVVRENAAQYPPNKEFLTELYIAYGLSAYKTIGEDDQPRMVLQMNDTTAHFSGMEYIREIARMGPAVTRFKGNEPAMAAGFRDYRELLALARNEIWDAASVIALGKIIDRYKLSNISDRPIWNADQYELSQRHPKSLKLLTYFFKNAQDSAVTQEAVNLQEAVDVQKSSVAQDTVNSREAAELQESASVQGEASLQETANDQRKNNEQKTAYLQVTARAELPAEAYRMLWSHLGLESVTHGREKLLYGGLRKAVLDHVPGMIEQPKVDYNKLNLEFFYNFHRGGITHFRNEGQTLEEREKLDRFLRREDVQIALWDEGYVDKQILHYWISRRSGSYLLDQLEAFYSAHRDMSLANCVLDKIKSARDYKRIDTTLEEDAQVVPVEGGFDIKNRACLRYYLHAAFHLACGVQNQIILGNFLQDRMPYSEEWSRRFAGAAAGELEVRHPLEIRFGEAGEDVLSIMFHPRYLEYSWNGSPMIPRFPGQALAEVEDDTYFWLLAPVAAAPYEAYSGIYQELVNRLSRLPAWEGDIPMIADCIAGSICYFEENQEPICTLHAEKKDQLFGCDIYEDGTLIFYEETNERKITISQDDNVPDVETAIKMGRRLLREMTTEWDVDVHLELLPEQILVRDKWNIASALAGEEVTEEAIHKYLKEYFKGKIRRLELDFGGRALVFLKDGEMKRYACLYFEHLKQRWFRLVGMPEVYEVVDEKDVVYEPFGLGMLPNYVIHHNPRYMESRLEEVFDQVACEEPNPAFLMWSSQVYFTAESQQYHLAQRLFGAYSPEQACSRLQEQFYIPVLPKEISYNDEDGKQWKPIDNARDKGFVQDMLARYMAGRLDRLVLEWEYSVEYTSGTKDVRNRCIVLVQDQGKHQMIFSDDSQSGITYLVANVGEYLNAKGKKYRKVDFCGRTVPGYLVHMDMRRIRDCLDLLIPQIENPSMILGQLGEFAYVGREECEENHLLM